MAESLASIYKAPGLILVLEQISLLTKQEKKQTLFYLGMVVCACNPNTWEEDQESRPDSAKILILKHMKLTKKS